jgi:enoyl-CoA hydratase
LKYNNYYTILNLNFNLNLSGGAVEFKNIITEITDGIGYLIINRPEAMNALNQETLGEIAVGLKKLAEDKNVRAIVITGQGEKAFVAGADVEALSKMKAEDAWEFISQGHRCLATIEECSKPVIAAVNGFALGGGLELALACDFIYACVKAKFGLPEVKLGIFPGFGGTQRLPRLIGAAQAKELIFTGRMIDAQEAYRLGIINKIVPEKALMEEVRALIKEISANSLAAVGLAKYSINAGDTKDLDQGLNIERDNFHKSFQAEDREEGFKAFLEKRRPNFKNN